MSLRGMEIHSMITDEAEEVVDAIRYSSDRFGIPDVGFISPNVYDTLAESLNADSFVTSVNGIRFGTSTSTSSSATITIQNQEEEIKDLRSRVEYLEDQLEKVLFLLNKEAA